MKNLQGWMILGIACLAGCVGTTIPVQAQQTATTIVVKERLVEHVGDRLIIDMKLALDELSLPANRSLVCTPLIERGDSVRALPPVIVNGRNRQIQYDRSGRDAAANGSRPEQRVTIPADEIVTIKPVPERSMTRPRP